MITSKFWAWFCDGTFQEIDVVAENELSTLIKATDSLVGPINKCLGFSDVPRIDLKCELCDSVNSYTPDTWYKLCNAVNACPDCGNNNKKE